MLKALYTEIKFENPEVLLYVSDFALVIELLYKQKVGKEQSKC